MTTRSTVSRTNVRVSALHPAEGPSAKSSGRDSSRPRTATTSRSTSSALMRASEPASGRRSCSSALLMYIVAITVASADRIGRGHDVAPVVINQAAEEGAGLDPRLPPNSCDWPPAGLGPPSKAPRPRSPCAHPDTRRPCVRPRPDRCGSAGDGRGHRGRTSRRPCARPEIRMRCLLRIPRCSRSVRSFARQPTARYWRKTRRTRSASCSLMTSLLSAESKAV